MAATYYLNTSALVKRYHVERGTTRLDMVFAEPDATFVIASIEQPHTPEVQRDAASGQEDQADALNHAKIQAQPPSALEDLEETAIPPCGGCSNSRLWELGKARSRREL